MVDRNPSNGSQETKLLAESLLLLLLLLKEHWMMIMQVVLLVMVVCVLVLLKGMEEIVTITVVRILEDIVEMVGVRL